MLDLIIVTGASKGIGASIANKCMPICKTMIAVASSDKIKNLSGSECNVIPIQTNLSDYTKSQRLIYDEVSKLENINSIGFVLAAAQLGQSGGLLATDLESWDSQYKCNVLGNLAVVQACSNLISSGIKTRVVMFAGGGAAYGYPDFFGYSLSKTANVRAAENLGIELAKINNDASVIALAPGAVATDMLSKVIASGASVKTFTDISEPTNFVYSFLNDEFDSKALNGRFLHVRDNLNKEPITGTLFQLRRVE